MQGLDGEPHVDHKLFKQMFLERLAANVQAILASGSEDLSVSGVAKVADRMFEVQRLQPLSAAQLSISPLATPTYIDDLLVASQNAEEHKGHLSLMFDRLDKSSVISNPSKCVLDLPSLELLGHHVDSEGLRPQSSKVEGIRDLPPPTSKRQLQQFIGMINFYRRFLPNCADLMMPLTKMLSGPKGLLELTGEALTAFERIKNSLADATLLTRPAPGAPLSLMVDSAAVVVGAVLQQHLAGSNRPQAFFSKKLLPTETRYSTFGREPLATYLAVKHFRHFLEGRDFAIFTDHKPLTFALRSHSDKCDPRKIAHLDYISQFTTGIRHIDGTKKGG
ncbi:hypothetical protein SprV_0100360100 [Sparganum proliferum]